MDVPDPTGVSVMDELVARTERQLERMRDLGDRMAEVRARESSPDGAVTVEVDGNGALLDLVFSPLVNRLTPAEFEQVVVSTAQRAAARAFARRGALITAFNEDNGAGPRPESQEPPHHESPHPPRRMTRNSVDAAHREIHRRVTRS
ncbi:YbaB/EbfC family nucleoid-associated protein [Nocardia spumae]|uniref:YbaB/EbfC family nucleoid-associated protein n=1 Tax=Nocardia spumae TaxID=2887190 RepID=UPI0027E0C597|nr:YbaB/EbfC family nucleoid-associated protein [Nocardia spumae]